jgi:hypothetical protein
MLILNLTRALNVYTMFCMIFIGFGYASILSPRLSLFNNNLYGIEEHVLDANTGKQ